MGQASPSPDRIGKYEVRRVLGRGAMGVVYLAYDPDLRREVALKTMSGLFAAGDDVTDRFYREARSAGSLRHPRIVTVYELGEDGGIPYIAMERLRGRDLHTLVREDGPPPPRRALEIVAAIAEGLDFAHRSGVIHRDVKPANIFIDDEGEVTLVDFGIAKMADTDVTRTGVVVGSVDYMAPEQIRGRPPLDGRGDLWAAVVILYELLFHRKPFTAKDRDLTAVMFRIVQSPPLGAARMARLLPRSLAQVLLRGLEKDRDHRFRDGRALAAALRAVLAGEPHLDAKVAAVREAVVGTGDADDDEEATRAPIALVLEPPAAGPARRRRRVALLVLGAVAAAGLLVVATRLASREAGPEETLLASPGPGFVALNVAPWAMLTGLEDAATGKAVALPGGRAVITPARIALPAGRYRARLENPVFDEPLEVDLDVRAGALTSLTDLRLPGLDLDAAVDALVTLSLPEEDAP